MTLEEMEAELVTIDENIERMTTFSIRNGYASDDSLDMKEYLLAVSRRDRLVIKIDVAKTVNKLTDELG